MNFLKKFFKYFAIVLAVIVVLLYATGNKHIFKAVGTTYLKGKMGPAINESQIFANRVVKAGNYQAWPKAVNYNKVKMPDADRKVAEEFKTIAYVIIKNDSLVYEEYWDDFNADSQTNSFSMAKSILGVLAGIAIKEGKIKDINEPIGNYLPQYKEGKNAKITIQHLLNMSSGINFDEDYVSPFAYPARAYYGTDLETLTFNGYQSETEPGKIFKYLSGDSQLLAFVIEKATGKTVSDYASEKLWKPIGAKNDALWNLDHENGHEKAFCCFNSNAPDFARIGSLYLHNGNWKGNQIIDSTYIAASTNPVAGFKEADGSACVRYSNQWWMIPNFKGHKVFYMRGILGQYVMMVPDLQLVVVRLGHKRVKTKATDLYPSDIDAYLGAAIEMTK